jgi:pimeloyl-ACP methyl ester carboxylesterase
LQDRVGLTVRDIEAEYAADRPKRARELAVARTELRPEIAEIARAGYPFGPDLYADIDCPTLVLRQDTDSDQRRADLDAAAALSDGRLVHVPDAGHCVFRDRYAAAMTELRGFLLRV